VTSGCCRGDSQADVRRVFPDADGFPAVICFDAAEGELRRRFRKSRHGASRIAVHLRNVAPDPDARWRRWGWDWDEFNRSSGVVLPNEDLPYLAGLLEHATREASGQLVLAPWRDRGSISSAMAPPARDNGGTMNPTPGGSIRVEAGS
jgi:hypothetical protein